MKSPLVALLIAPDEEMWMAVISGAKKITIREGHRSYVSGRPVMICCHLCSYVVMADIVSVHHCLLRNVTKKEYEADGFKSRSELLAGLRKFYPDLKMNSPITIIGWDNVRGKLIDDHKDFLDQCEKASLGLIDSAPLVGAS